MKTKESADIVIVGGGPSGLTAGLYSARGGMETFIIDKSGPGGQMVFSELIENYPGFPDGISGMDLGRLMESQAEKFGVKNRLETVEKVIPGKGEITIKTDSAEYRSFALILAPGSIPRKLGIPGEKALTGRGVSYCALCDGPVFAGQEIAVIGGGDAAVHEAITLAKFSKKVHLIHRRKTLRAAKTLQEKLFAVKNIEFIPETTVSSINGEKTVESITLSGTNDARSREKKISGVFIAAGYEPDTNFIKGVAPLDGEGYIITDRKCGTKTEGIYACGDAVSGNLKQVASACGSGAAAAASAVDYVENLKGTSYG